MAGPTSLQFEIFLRVCEGHAGDYDGAIRALRTEGFRPGQARAEVTAANSKAAAFTKTVDGVHYDVMLVWMSDWFDESHPGTLCAVHSNPADPGALAQARAYAVAPRYKEEEGREFYVFRREAGASRPQTSSDPDDRDTRRMMIEGDDKATTLTLITR